MLNQKSTLALSILVITLGLTACQKSDSKKAEPTVAVAQEVEKPRLQPVAVLNEPVEMSQEEYRAMIEMAKNAGPEDCEMCGS